MVVHLSERALGKPFTRSRYTWRIMIVPPAAESVTAPRALAWMIGLSRSHAWIFILLCLDLAVLGDLVTGTRLWFGPGYLLVMSLAAWCLGWRPGFTVGLASIALTFAVNGVALYPDGAVNLLWNLAARTIAISLVIAVVAGSRRAYLREWWLARSDPLTGAFNRQAFFELGAAMAQRRSWRVLFFADLDGLKLINDEHGHGAGDAALRDYAAVVRRNIRGGDLFARVGGDEFLIFMAIRDPGSGRNIAERLHRRMNTIPLQHGGVSRCSLGVLLIPPGAYSMDSLVRQADAVMYRAKLDGASLQMGRADRKPEESPDVTDYAARRGGPEKIRGLRAPASALLPSFPIEPSGLAPSARHMARFHRRSDDRAGGRIAT